MAQGDIPYKFHREYFNMALSFVPNKDDKSSGTNSVESKNEISIITDEPLTSAPDLNKHSKTLSTIITNSQPRFTVGIYGGWGTGKTTIMQMILKHLAKEDNNIITIWFDAWRYENEEFSALVPLVRTIILHLEEYVQKLELEKNPKAAVIKNLVNKFKKVGKSIIMSSKTNLGLEYSGAKASVETDVGNAIEYYKSEGSFYKNQNKIYFHKHISDFVSDELKDIRKRVETKNFKIVIFVDDLDRCTPERALEILESIKTFFDMEGIIFVIGIDPSTIDPIIKTKYGEDSKIDGMKYLQKIVQLPYTIPLWNPPRLSDTITNMMKETHLPNEVIKKVLEPKMQELIIKATELNPRDVKRFINSIVISHVIYGHEIDDIEKIIVIQAFYFHGDKWIEFLKLLIPNKQRIAFLMHFILWLGRESTNISNLYDLKNVLQGDKTLEKDDYIYKSLAEKPLLDIYKKLIDIDDNQLFTFLSLSKETLLRIDKIERYLMVSDPIGMTNKVEKFLDIDSRKQLNLLRDRQVAEFNKYLQQGIPIHLPIEKLSGSDLRGFSLRGSMLFMSDLSVANLSAADLSEADLTGADLSGAMLPQAKLSGAMLPQAKLSGAMLPQAKLFGANLTGADLSGAMLRRANLSAANLSGADLTGADLTGAMLHQANLSAANLTGAKLSDTVIINCIFSKVIVDTHTDFFNALIDNPDFLKHLREKGSQNIPNDINNKQELRKELLKKRNFDPDMLDIYLSSSQLPES
jgi:uncharacterized protein YjbI with pentapeptide repeats